MSSIFSARVSLEVSRLFPASSFSTCLLLLFVICHHLPLMFSDILPSLFPPLPSFHSGTLPSSAILQFHIICLDLLAVCSHPFSSPLSHPYGDVQNVALNALPCLSMPVLLPICAGSQPLPQLTWLLALQTEGLT